MNDHKDVEVAIVALANAIVNPGAVVVEPFNALVAVTAVKTSRCPYQATLRAHLRRIHSAQYRDKVHLRVTLEKSWILLPDDDPKEKRDGEENLVRVKDPRVGRRIVFAKHWQGRKLHQSHREDHEDEVEDES